MYPPSLKKTASKNNIKPSTIAILFKTQPTEKGAISENVLQRNKTKTGSTNLYNVLIWKQYHGDQTQTRERT